MPDKKEDILEKVSAREFLNKLSKKIEKYENESLKGIPTCDIQDVWNWIEKTEKQFQKKLNNK